MTATDGQTSALTDITDEHMREMLDKSKTYTVMLLLMTEKANASDARKIIWEHGRGNAALRAAGKLPIACPATDDSDRASTQKIRQSMQSG
jgi:hypothetical protein